MYWIEHGDHIERGFTTLTAAKQRARLIMKQSGELLPFVQVINEDDSEAWHFDPLSGRWHHDTA